MQRPEQSGHLPNLSPASWPNSRTGPRPLAGPRTHPTDGSSPTAGPASTSPILLSPGAWPPTTSLSGPPVQPGWSNSPGTFRLQSSPPCSASTSLPPSSGANAPPPTGGGRPPPPRRTAPSPCAAGSPPPPAPAPVLQHRPQEACARGAWSPSSGSGILICTTRRPWPFRSAVAPPSAAATMES